MPSNNSVLDISLLRNNPTEFLLRCQRIIHICVKQFIASGMFNAEDELDMVQTVNEELIAKLPAIEAQYNGMALMQTYMNTIIQNICLKIYRKSHQTVKTAPLQTVMTHLSNDPSNNIIIHQELERFHAILQMLHGKRYKVLFFVRLYLGIQMKPADLRDILHQMTLEERKKLSETLLKGGDEYSIPQRFEHMAAVYNKYSKRKKVSPIALQRWTERQINLLITLLNGNPPVRYYTQESLTVLIEEYYLRKIGTN